jgi:hypothetical protein
LTSKKIGDSERLAAIGYVNQFGTSHDTEERGGDVRQTSVTGRCKIDLARIGFGIGDELGNSPNRYRWIDLHDERYTADARDWKDVANKIELEARGKCRIDCVRLSDQKERMAVWC